MKLKQNGEIMDKIKATVQQDLDYEVGKKLWNFSSFSQNYRLGTI